MHVKILQKNVFVENVWPANLALFVYVSTHCVETVKWLAYNPYCQLTRWCSGNASDLGAKGPGFSPRIRQGFLCFIFFALLLLCFTFLSKTHYLSQKFAIPFILLIYLVYFTYCKICDRLYGYKDTDLASLKLDQRLLRFAYTCYICLNRLNIVLVSAVVRFKSPARCRIINAHAKQYDNNRPTLG